MRVQIEDLVAVRIAASGGRLALIAAARPSESPPPERIDATISGSPFALLQLARGLGPAGSRDSAGAAVSGDAEVANLYRQLFALARPDFEEELSRLVGDLPARQLSLFARDAVAWLRNARRTAGANIAEYLQEESRDLVSKPEVDEFLQGVDGLREAVDRVAARLAGLEQRLKASA